MSEVTIVIERTQKKRKKKKAAHHRHSKHHHHTSHDDQQQMAAIAPHASLLGSNAARPLRNANREHYYLIFNKDAATESSSADKSCSAYTHLKTRWTTQCVLALHQRLAEAIEERDRLRSVIEDWRAANTDDDDDEEDEEDVNVEDENGSNDNEADVESKNISKGAASPIKNTSLRKEKIRSVDKIRASWESNSVPASSTRQYAGGLRDSVSLRHPRPKVSSLIEQWEVKAKEEKEIAEAAISPRARSISFEQLGTISPRHYMTTTTTTPTTTTTTTNNSTNNNNQA